MNRIVEVSALKKSYQEIEAVKGIDFYMEEGTLLAFLGPNGAGKSTTIDIITTFLKPDSGEVFIDGFLLGKEDHKIREVIGAVFQEGLLDKKLSVKENLFCRGSLYGMSKKELSKAVQEVLQLCELEDIADRYYGNLSGGQRRRCDIARALLHTPKLLFLDEPTTGLDPQTRNMLWNVIAKLQKEKGMSVFLTTHYMEEAARADYVIVMDEGNIVAQGTPLDLKQSYARDRVCLYPLQSETLEAFLQQKQIAFHKSNERYIVYLEHSFDALSLLENCKSLLQDFEVLHGTMDDAFIEIIGKRIRE